MGGKTSAKAKNAWVAKTYDRINLTVPKGRKEEIQAEAERRGQSVNGFINSLIDEALGRERTGDNGSSAGAFSIFSDESEAPHGDS